MNAWLWYVRMLAVMLWKCLYLLESLPWERTYQHAQTFKEKYVKQSSAENIKTNDY